MTSTIETFSIKKFTILLWSHSHKKYWIWWSIFAFFSKVFIFQPIIKTFIFPEQNEYWSFEAVNFYCDMQIFWIQILKQEQLNSFGFSIFQSNSLVQKLKELKLCKDNQFPNIGCVIGLFVIHKLFAFFWNKN